MEEVVIKGKLYEIKRANGFGVSATAKLSGNTIEIKIPIYLGREEGLRVFLNLKGRIIKSLTNAKEYRPKPAHLVFYDGQLLQLLGRNFSIKIIEIDRKNSTASLKYETITINLSSRLSKKEKGKHIYSLSRRIISRQVLPDLVMHINELNDRHFKFDLNGVKLKEQSTRWGSYSKSTNSININFRLLFAPMAVMDSVIIHELVHIKHQNHQKEFWNLVLGAMPDYKANRKWLRKNGSSLGVFPRPVEKMQTSENPIIDLEGSNTDKINVQDGVPNEPMLNRSYSQ